MTQYVTTDDLLDLEREIRAEYTETIRYYEDRVLGRLDDQDNTLKWINRTVITSLVLIICALIGLVILLQ